MWIYQVRMLSKRGGHVFGYDHALTESEYRHPSIRAYAEQVAERKLREIEGVTPDMPLEHRGWHHVDMNPH